MQIISIAKQYDSFGQRDSITSNNSMCVMVGELNDGSSGKLLLSLGVVEDILWYW